MKTGTPHKNVPPQKERHTTFFISFSVSSTRRPNAGAQGGEIPLPRATLRSREREGKVFPRPALRSSQRQALVVHHLLLKVRLGVVTHRAHLRCLGTNVQMSAVQALPHLYALALKHLARLNALDELVVALLVGLLDGGDATELLGDLGKTLLLGGANSSYIVVHS